MPQNLKSLVTQSLYPKITTVTTGSATAVIPAGGETVTVTGSGFLSGAVVWINNSNVSTTFTSSTTLTFTSPAQSAGFYQLFVYNTDGSVATKPGGLIYNAAPVWSTASGALLPLVTNVAYSTTLVATSGTITYSITSGSLPSGISLNSSTGVISGTSSDTTGTFSFTVAATNEYNQITTRNFSITVSALIVETLIIAGGGAGGGAGAGAGGLLYYGSETPKTPNGSALGLQTGVTYSITVGAGGTSSGNGSNSVMSGSGFTTLTAIGGGGAPGGGNNGGSGGGAGRLTPSSIGLGTTGQGNNGGTGVDANNTSGGGGGAGGVGGNSSTTGGNGGAGLNYSISGSSVGYAGGGGGGGMNGGGSATQGGGAGAIGGAASGTTNRGGGGGGIYTNGPGAGGSGIVILRYTDALPAAASTTGSPTYTVAGGYRVYAFTGNGSITF
jgi:hypothetical protein